MLIISYIIFFFIIPLCFYKFFMNYNHLLVSLFILEMISLSFFMGLVSMMQIFVFEGVYLLYFLVMVTCEGVLGLCLLVVMSFYYSGDYLYLFNKLSC